MRLNSSVTTKSGAQPEHRLLFPKLSSRRRDNSALPTALCALPFPHSSLLASFHLRSSHSGIQKINYFITTKRSRTQGYTNQHILDNAFKILQRKQSYTMHITARTTTNHRGIKEFHIAYWHLKSQYPYNLLLNFKQRRIVSNVSFLTSKLSLARHRQPRLWR